MKFQQPCPFPRKRLVLSVASLVFPLSMLTPAAQAQSQDEDSDERLPVVLVTLGLDESARQVDGNIQPDHPVGMRQVKGLMFDGLDPLDQFAAGWFLESCALVGKVGGNVAVTDDDVAGLKRCLQQAARFVAIPRIKHRGQLWMDILQRAKATVEECANGGSKPGFTVSRKAKQLGLEVFLAESVNEVAGLGPLAGTINALDRNQQSHVGVCPCRGSEA